MPVDLPVSKAAALLLDTGAFVALVDRSERRHADCVAVLEGWAGLLLTTEAVLTETLYLVGPQWEAQRVCFEFFRRGALKLIPSSSVSLLRVAELMKKYQDLPMDFADGTLVALGEELDTDQVFTLDRRGFAVYRLHGKKPFQVFP
ncbi:MAG: PIN domain-containing protein [Chloroflexi bacterium]|nr:PIN domain-containing protein [Chloroflexota bacterium]